MNNNKNNDLLEKFNAPINFDYLSIDTEGNEYQILETFDFTKYQPKIITCEHNYRTEREKISNLLIKNGYKKFQSKFTKYDDLFIID